MAPNIIYLYAYMDSLRKSQNINPTYLLSPSSIIWYQSWGSDVLRLGR